MSWQSCHNLSSSSYGQPLEPFWLTISCVMLEWGARLLWHSVATCGHCHLSRLREFSFSALFYFSHFSHQFFSCSFNKQFFTHCVAVTTRFLGDLWLHRHVTILLQLFSCHHRDAMQPCCPDAEFLAYSVDFHVAADSTQGTTTWLSMIIHRRHARSPL